MPIHDHLDLIRDKSRCLTDEDIRKLKEAAKGFPVQPYWQSTRRMLPRDYFADQPQDFRLNRRDSAHVAEALSEKPLWAQLLLLAE